MRLTGVPGRAPAFVYFLTVDAPWPMALPPASLTFLELTSRASQYTTYYKAHTVGPGVFLLTVQCPAPTERIAHKSLVYEVQFLLITLFYHCCLVGQLG